MRLKPYGTCTTKFGPIDWKLIGPDHAIIEFGEPHLSYDRGYSDRAPAMVVRGQPYLGWLRMHCFDGSGWKVADHVKRVDAQGCERGDYGYEWVAWEDSQHRARFAVNIRKDVGYSHATATVIALVVKVVQEGLSIGQDERNKARTMVAHAELATAREEAAKAKAEYHSRAAATLPKLLEFEKALRAQGVEFGDIEEAYAAMSAPEEAGADVG